METKVCTKCKIEKQISEFYKRKERNNRPSSQCKECQIKKSSKWNKDNWDRYLNNSLTCYHLNKEAAHKKEQKKNYGTLYRKVHIDRVRAHCSKRRAILKSNMPKWANEDKILSVFTEAKVREELTGIKYHVDHIIPLRGKIKGVHVVCGLHCEDNLEILPSKENLEKWCSVWQDMPKE